MLPYLFAALTMTAVGKAAYEIVLEVRRQFAEMPGIMERTTKPDYKTCVAISTQSALREMVIPGALAVVVPLLIGFVLGAQALAGMLIGAIASGFMLAVMMANSGGAWDNAKKWIETGVMGGKGSEAHKAAVVGDTVGDPFKDTSGPSLNILIKLMSIVSLVFASAFGEGWAQSVLSRLASGLLQEQLRQQHESEQDQAAGQERDPALAQPLRPRREPPVRRVGLIAPVQLLRPFVAAPFAPWPATRRDCRSSQAPMSLART